MRPSELFTVATEFIKTRQPLLITGAPGIGKSDIVSQACDAVGADMILSHPAVADPTDAKGLPWVVNGEATFLPFGEMSRALAAEKPTVWFLDDLGQASAAVQASYMQLLLARRVNGHVLSDYVTFIAATNRRTDRAGVSGILEPVKSRFTSIVELEPNLDDWINWAIDHSCPPELIAFMRFRPDLLAAFEAKADLTNSPLPRTWSHVAKIVNMSLPHGIMSQAVSGAVGAGAATEFLSFLTMYRQLPNIDLILADGKATDLPTQPAVLYAISSALAHKADMTNFAQIAVYLNRLMEAGHGEFGVLCFADAVRRMPSLRNTKAFNTIATGDLGQLISGS